MDANNPSDQTVLRRRVYYLSGFDPRGARFYHQIYRDEARKQALVNGIKLDVGSRKKVGEHAVMWSVQSQQNDQTTTTDYTFLVWDDLVRAHWPASAWAVLRQLPRFYWVYGLGGGFQRLWRCSRRTVATSLTPFVFAMLTALLASVLAFALPWLVGMAGAAVVVWLAVVGANRWQLVWLSRILLFLRYWGQDDGNDLTQRWTLLAHHIARDLDDKPECDEVLLVGHSVGSMAAVSVMSELLYHCKQGLEDENRQIVDKLRLLTLGQTTPMLSFFPEASRFREQVRHVAASSVPWLDVSSPSDPLCVALTDPTIGSAQNGDVQQSASAKRVWVRSARFDRMFDAVAYKKLVKDAFRIHFQYLMATDLPAHNDYFAITAGPKPLAHWMQPPT